MKMIVSTLIFSAFVMVPGGGFFSSSQGVQIAFAADELTPAQRGRGKAQMCTRCHGRLGLAKAARERGWEGTLEAFIAGNLHSFRDGSRLHAVMNAVAKPMSDLDITDVAAWYDKVSGFEKAP